MTDVALQDERALRLARLRERRGPAAAPSSAPTPAPSVSAERSVAPRRRRSVAANAKIITVGASATAVLGMIAGYGIADGLDSPGAGAASAAVVPTAPVAPAPVGAATPVTPQVVLVVVDGATGTTLRTAPGSGDLAADLTALGVVPAGTGTIGLERVATPVPVAVPAPAAVELAVPAPPSAAQVAPGTPAPAPAPQAVSEGS